MFTSLARVTRVGDLNLLPSPTVTSHNIHLIHSTFRFDLLVCAANRQSLDHMSFSTAGHAVPTSLEFCLLETRLDKGIFLVFTDARNTATTNEVLCSLRLAGLTAASCFP